MPERKTGLRFDEKFYTVRPDMRLIGEIEQELGGIPVLLSRFDSGAWHVCDLVALIQMMLQSAGKTTDFIILGNRIIEEGVDLYLATAKRFLAGIMNVEAA